MRPHGTAIRDIRNGQNLGLRALAERAGIDRGHLSRIERGEVRNPASATLHRIAAALKVPVDAITITEEKT
ncbi:helix-turn-helix domain-containing protein [Streptomyces sp. PD-S100-1]|uniref:helix-turn-helix domain-containing protein n=1 Tax=Streptomyces sp. PD-S100-1 TaxID=3394351 RepID=UPI0039BCEC5D